MVWPASGAEVCLLQWPLGRALTGLRWTGDRPVRTRRPEIAMTFRPIYRALAPLAISRLTR
jgi:hypothetical protein